MTDTVDLKPCPFCGCDCPTWHTVRDGRSFGCSGCGRRFVEYNGPADKTAEDRLVAKWNTRTAPVVEPYDVKRMWDLAEYLEGTDPDSTSQNDATSLRAILSALQAEPAEGNRESPQKEYSPEPERWGSWIEHEGTQCPVPPDTFVHTISWSGCWKEYYARYMNWSDTSAQSHVIRYRTLKAEPAEPAAITPAQAAKVLLGGRLPASAVEAALVGHYGKRAIEIGIHGLDLTSNGMNWSFNDGFRRMWRAALKSLAGESDQ